MPAQLRPRDEAETARVVSWAVAERKPLEIVGGGSKRAVGRPFQAEYTLNLSGVAGVTMYEPEELVLQAWAGTTIAEINELLASKGQALPFEPPDFTEFLGTSRGPATLGGALASNLSGPRRIKAGAVRDHVLGLRAITGRAETVKLGGRVMKNVTGYDLCRGLAGSWGTLAVMTEITIKVLPAAPTRATLVVPGLSADQAVKAMSAALGSTAEVSGACHVPAPLAARSRAPSVAASGRSVTALRLEGVAPSVAARREALTAVLRSHGAVEELSVVEATALWTEVRDVTLFERTDKHVVWRISTAPGKAAGITRAVSAGQDVEALYDWGGGLVWLQQPADGDGGAGTVRAAVAEAGGHATLVRASPPTRTAVNVFQPQPEALASLTRRIKAAFDPHGILNPGRMYAGV